MEKFLKNLYFHYICNNFENTKEWCRFAFLLKNERYYLNIQ